MLAFYTSLADYKAMFKSASNTFDLATNFPARRQAYVDVESVTYLSICNVDGQIYVTERSWSNFSDKLVFSTDYEFGLGATAARHNVLNDNLLPILFRNFCVAARVTAEHRVLYVQSMLIWVFMD